MSDGDDRRFLLDASAFITLAGIEAVDLLDGLAGTCEIPDPVAREITDDPATTALQAAERAGRIERAPPPSEAAIETARGHLGAPDTGEPPRGDVTLLAAAVEAEEAVVITDDKPLRKACKALGIPLSGSIGAVIAAVERGDVEPVQAKELLAAMDEIGARLSARLLRRAERLIDAAAERDRRTPEEDS